MCKFLNQDGICFLHKGECTIPDSKISKCNYYKRQHPKDEAILRGKVLRSLKSLATKRDFTLIPEKVEINPSLSVYENVKCFLDTIPKTTITLRSRKQIDTSILKSNNILKAVTEQLYDEEIVEIVEKNEKENTLIVLKEGQKLKVLLKDKVNVFLKDLHKKKDKSSYFKQQALEVVLL